MCAQRRLRHDQPGHPPSLIRVFAVRMKKAWVLNYPLSAKRRLWSDWPVSSLGAQSFRWFCHEVAQLYNLLHCFQVHLEYRQKYTLQNWNSKSFIYVFFFAESAAMLVLNTKIPMEHWLGIFFKSESAMIFNLNSSLHTNSHSSFRVCIKLFHCETMEGLHSHCFWNRFLGGTILTLPVWNIP